jgi:hypothetical protein
MTTLMISGRRMPAPHIPASELAAEHSELDQRTGPQLSEPSGTDSYAGPMA